MLFWEGEKRSDNVNDDVVFADKRDKEKTRNMILNYR